MADQSKLIAGGSIAVGSILLWSAINNRKVLDTTRHLVAGTKPTPGPQSGVFSTNILVPGSPITATAIGPGAESAAAVDALQYQGAGYVWGGAPAKGIGNWDCSSFANWVYGHDLGIDIPGYKGGTYTGESHGPPTGVWLLWGGLHTVGHSGLDAQAGDLCIWQTHMGIAIGGGQMISAQDAQNGTQVSGIDGFIPEALFVRRYRTAPAGITGRGVG